MQNELADTMKGANRARKKTNYKRRRITVRLNTNKGRSHFVGTLNLGVRTQVKNERPRPSEARVPNPINTLSISLPPRGMHIYYIHDSKPQNNRTDIWGQRMDRNGNKCICRYMYIKKELMLCCFHAGRVRWPFLPPVFPQKPTRIRQRKGCKTR